MKRILIILAIVFFILLALKVGGLVILMAVSIFKILIGIGVLLIFGTLGYVVYNIFKK